MKKSVLIADKNGQLGNRLFLFAHYISNSIENNYRLYFPGFDDMSEYFESASKNYYGDYPVKSRISKLKIVNKAGYFFVRTLAATLFRTVPVSRWHRIIRLYETNDLGIDRYDFYDLEKEKDFFEDDKLFILQGWNFRSPQNVLRHKEKVRPLFHLKDHLRKKINDFITECRKECDVLIGVHVRRGDYKTYSNGAFYYEDAVYKKFMKQISDLLPGKKAGFIICSNVDITIKELNGSKIISGPGHFVEDMYTLAECDYIIGPPSTYSQWASYYGDKPLRILWDQEKPISSLGEFKISPL